MNLRNAIQESDVMPPSLVASECQISKGKFALETRPPTVSQKGGWTEKTERYSKGKFMNLQQLNNLWLILKLWHAVIC